MGDVGNQAVKILVVDRDLTAGQQICAAVSSEGFSCQHFSNAAGALTNARQSIPALMIVDAQLDACSGFDFARTVHASILGRTSRSFSCPSRVQRTYWRNRETRAGFIS